MPLLCINKGTSPIELVVGMPHPIIPAGQIMVIDGYMKDNTVDDWAALEAQASQRSDLLFDWLGTPSFSVGSLRVGTVPEDDSHTILYSKTVVLDGPDITGQMIAIPLFGIDENGDELPAIDPIEIVSTEFRLQRGAPGAEVYLCCNQLGEHSDDQPLSDKYSAENGEVLTERATTARRMLHAGHMLYVICSTDYVQGLFRVEYQKVKE